MAGPKPVETTPIVILRQLKKEDPNLRRITDRAHVPCAARVEQCVAERNRLEYAKWVPIPERDAAEESPRGRTAPVAVARTLVTMTPEHGVVTDIFTDGGQDRAANMALNDPRLHAAHDALRFGSTYLSQSGLGLTDGRLQLTIERGEIDASASAWFRGADRLTMTASDTDGDQVHDYVIVAVRRGAALLVVDYKAVPSAVSTR